jgi:hypothetical protein
MPIRLFESIQYLKTDEKCDTIRLKEHETYTIEYDG